MAITERDLKVAETVLGLTAPPLEDFDTVKFLRHLTDRVCELLPVRAAGVTLLDGRGRAAVATASDRVTEALEQAQLDWQEGPGPDCAGGRSPVGFTDLAEGAVRWPRFASLAVRAGFTAVAAVPMRWDDRMIGTLDLMTTVPPDRRTEGSDGSGCSNGVDGVDGVDGAGGANEVNGVHGTPGAQGIRCAQLLATAATIGLLHRKLLWDQSALIVQLRSALDSRVVIEQAKGVLSACARIPLDEAFDRLRRHARSRQRRLGELAADVVRGDIPPILLRPRP
ncbi:transcriptional regulator [Streptomyces poonensis]|uniref:Transcriptional regulator n=2 Tax=Streptomyces poonensis TaxID=68255 RepID=A0A918PNF3_9ACTN|nr:transcriptional regulator [Streptomyces poonensis]GLJ91532.1 transcriptional regulator [Streptomyces poonensis]